MADEDIVNTITGDTITRSEIVNSNKQFYEEAYNKKLTDICDFSEGSEIRTLHESIAVDVINLYKVLYNTHKMKFINYASGFYLDELGCEQHISRKSSQVARGQVEFSIPEIVSTDIVIPQGTVILQRNTGYEYILQENCIIAQGTLSKTGEVYSKITGARYNALANTLTAFQDIESIRNIITVTNPKPITGGVDAESDEEFRARIRNVKKEKAYGTVPSYENLIKQEVSGEVAEVHDIQMVDPNLLATSTAYPQHYEPNSNKICTKCTKVIFVNADSKPCPDEVIDEVDYVMTQQNNLVIGHIFHIQKAEVVPLYFSIHIYTDYPITEGVLADHIEAFLNGDEITTKIGTVKYAGLNIRETLYKSQLIDAIENIPGVHHVESIHRLRYKDLSSVDISEWIYNGSSYTYIDESNYVYNKTAEGDVDNWGEVNFDKIEIRSGRVFGLGAKYDIDKNSDTIFELTQTPYKE